MNPPEDKRLFLLDAMALIYRGYYAFINNPLINSKGVNTSAITGFTLALQNLLEKEKPTHIAVVFDTFAPTSRVEEHSFYKANRQETPQDIIESIGPIKELISGFRIPCIELDGYEADDIIGTLSKKAEAAGYVTYMVTPDKDYGQLVSDTVFMYKPGYQGKPHEVLGVPEVLAKWDIARVDQVIDMLGLMGDAVDNIPGIKGVGEKTAAKLLKEHDTIEQLLENTERVKGKMREKIEAGAEDARISKQLATIICDVPIEFREDELIMEAPDKEKLTAIFDEYEFRTLGKRILGEDYQFSGSSGPNSTQQMDLFGSADVPAAAGDMHSIEDVKHTYNLADNPGKRAELIQALKKETFICFDTETTSIDANDCELVGMAFSWQPQEGWYVPVPEDQQAARAVVDEFRSVFEDENITKLAHNIKYDLMVLKWYDIEVAGMLEDSLLVHYLLEPEKRHKMDYLSESYLNYRPVPIEDLIGKKGKNQRSMRSVDLDLIKEYATEDTDVTLQLFRHLHPLLKQHEADKLYRDVEMPLVRVLADMEHAGVRVDEHFLGDYSKELEADARNFQIQIFDKAGMEFNLNSPKQLGEVLFDRMKLPYTGKKTKTGQYSTAEDVLTKLAIEHVICQDILNFREVTKLKSTYVDALPQLINTKTGRIHSSFRQAVVPTGRLSSDNPNLQNIPIRTEKGRKIRQAFVPMNEEFQILSADYSQVELRIIASLGPDENMIQAFKKGADIHTTTASNVFGVSMEAVDREMRRKAKAVNFGLAYGQSAFGLAQSLGISRTEAKEIIDNYFNSYPGIKKYMDDSVASAKKLGYAKTVMGRRRYLPDINARNPTVRGFAERNAINMPIQGTAADIIKLAMVDLHREMKNRKLRSRLVLQVHDELVFEVHNEELEEMQSLVVERMKRAGELAVPLEVEAGVGRNWLEAH